MIPSASRGNNNQNQSKKKARAYTKEALPREKKNVSNIHGRLTRCVKSKYIKNEHTAVPDALTKKTPEIIFKKIENNGSCKFLLQQ